MRKDGVSGHSLLSLSLSFKRQRWDFYDPHYYCVWALLSLLQAADNHGHPVLYPQVCRFSSQTTHSNPTSWPRLKNCRMKKGRWWVLQSPVSHSTAVPCLVLSTCPAQFPLQLHCCLRTSLRWAQDSCPPCARHEHFWRLGGGSAGVVGQWPLGCTLPALSFSMCLLSDHNSSLLYLCLTLFSSSVFYFPFVEPHLH